jgi:hypothetical protein
VLLIETPNAACGRNPTRLTASRRRLRVRSADAFGLPLNDDAGAARIVRTKTLIRDKSPHSKTELRPDGFLVIPSATRSGTKATVSGVDGGRMRALCVPLPQPGVSEKAGLPP